MIDSEEKDLGKEGYFTTAQRICINQERGHLLQDHIYEDDYEQPPQIELKINFILGKLNANHNERNRIQDRINHQFNN